MTGNRLLAAAAAAALGMALVGCETTVEPPPFNPNDFQKTERNSGSQLATELRPALPTKLTDPMRQPKGSPTTAPVMPSTFDPMTGATKMTLREIVQRAVANNPEVRVAGYDPAIEGTRVVEAQAQFDPSFFTNLRYDRRDNATAGNFVSNPNNPSSTSVTFEDASDVYTIQSGLRQNLPTGGKAELSYQTAYNDLDPQRTSFNPYWENNLQLEITQPLLRNMGLEVNQANITIAQNNQRISVLEFRKVLEEQISNIEQTYWQLVAAVREVEIQDDLLRQTAKTVDILISRKTVDVSDLQVNQARSSEEERRNALVRARARVGELSDQLKRLMNDPTYPITSATVILPDTPALMEPVKLDLDEQINAGMDNRLELAQQQIRIQSAGVAASVAKNGLLPQLNLRGLMGFQGLEESLGGAFDSQLDFNHFNWGVGLEFEIPIGNRGPKSVYQRSLLQRQQAIDQYGVYVATVSVEVKTALREVMTTWSEIATSRNARFAAEAALTALQQREDANEPLTPTFVQLKLDTQERLSQSRTTEAQAISNYNFALARLERAKGTLLRYDNVMLEEAKTAYGMPKK
jgi:outer membrane protein TolC